MDAQAPRRTVVIDMGSNSFRLVAYNYEPGRWWRRSDEIYDTVRLGAGLQASGRLAEDRIETAIEAMEVYAHFCAASAIGSTQVSAVATSAVRDAANGAELLERVRALTGFPARILSTREEAYFAYLAAVNSTTLRDGAVLDLGGGSLQVVAVRERRALESASWRLGTVRMTERFFDPRRAAAAKQRDALRAHVLEELASAPWLARAGGSLVGIGGTVRNLAAAAAAAAGLPSIGVQGAVLERGALEQLIEELASRPVSRRAAIAGIKPGRAGLILAGAVVIAGAMEAIGSERLEVTHSGLREGVFFSSYLAGADPPLFDDVRVASVLNLAAQYQPDLLHCTHVAALAGQLLDSLNGGLAPARGLDLVQLLWAAAMLHDIGVSVDYDDHHKHSRYLILAAALPGFAPVETAIIAQAARYHRKGMPTPGPMAPLFGEGDAERLDRCAVLLRLAEDLERSRDQLVRGTRIELIDGEVELKLIAEGESAVPRWAAGREGELFERAFHRALSVAA